MFTSSDFITRIKDEDETMLAYLDILKNINKCGYITNNSQAGHEDKTYQINERAYVTGFMLESVAAQFIKEMALSTDKNAIFVPYYKDEEYNYPSKLDIPLTFDKKNDKIETHFSSILPKSVWDYFCTELYLDKCDDIVFIFCWDSKWNRNASGPSGLFTDILNTLKKITRLFVKNL